MKVAFTIARFLLGLMFTVFGLNGFLHFIPQPPPASPVALQYLTVLTITHYFVPVYLLQFVSGLLLLANRFVPLALALLAPVIANILLYHGTMDPKGIGAGLLAFLLWLVVFFSVRSYFRGLFAAKTIPADA